MLNGWSRPAVAGYVAWSWWWGSDCLVFPEIMSLGLEMRKHVLLQGFYSVRW